MFRSGFGEINMDDIGPAGNSTGRQRRAVGKFGNNLGTMAAEYRTKTVPEDAGKGWTNQQPRENSGFKNRRKNR